jgi:hypothetical protein
VLVLSEMESENAGLMAQQTSTTDLEEGPEEGLYRHSPWSSALLVMSHRVVFLVGLLGNLAVILIIFRSPRMKSSTNLYIASLALADLLVITICIPSNLLANIYVRKYPLLILKLRFGFKLWKFIISNFV